MAAIDSIDPAPSKAANGPSMAETTTMDRDGPPLVRLMRASAARGRVRPRTLCNLRWLAGGGQSAALFVVYFVFDYRLPFLACVFGIAASAALNTVLSFRYP